MDTKSKKLSESHTRIDLDYMFDDLGHFGRYQFIFVLTICVATLLGSGTYDYVFSVAKISHRCLIEECEEISNSTFKPDWLSHAVPVTDGTPASCIRYQPSGRPGNGTLEYCPAELFDITTTVECHSYVYETTYSMVYDFNLGCNEWLRSLAGSMSGMGTLFCQFLAGLVSDAYGRRTVLLGSVFFVGLWGVVKAFSQNYSMYLALQVLQTLLGSGYASAASIFVSEIVGPKHRMLANSATLCCIAFGEIWMAILAWRLQSSWRYFLLALNVPSLACGFFYFVLPESIRWLLSKQKYDALKKELEKIARINGRTIDDKFLKNISRKDENIESKKTPQRTNILLGVLRSRVLLSRVLILSMASLTANLVSKGLSINSTDLAGNMFLNYGLTSAMKIPGYFAPSVFGRFGRKANIVVYYFLAGLCNAAFVFIPKDMASLRLVTYLLGMTAISAATATRSVFRAELFPTEGRHSLASLVSTAGGLGGVFAPLTPALASYWEGAPSAMFAALGFITGLLILQLPETRGAAMPDTVEDAENLHKKP